MEDLPAVPVHPLANPELEAVRELLFRPGGPVAKLENLAAAFRDSRKVSEAKFSEYPWEIVGFGNYIDIPRYKSVQGPSMDFGLSIQLSDITLFDWWYEILWLESTWFLVYAIHRRDPREDSSDRFIEFPLRHGTGIESFSKAIDEMIDETCDPTWAMSVFEMPPKSSQ